LHIAPRGHSGAFRARHPAPSFDASLLPSTSLKSCVHESAPTSILNTQAAFILTPLFCSISVFSNYSSIAVLNDEKSRTDISLVGRYWFCHGNADVRFPTRNPEWDCEPMSSFCGARQPIRKLCSYKVTSRDPRIHHIEPKIQSLFQCLSVLPRLRSWVINYIPYAQPLLNVFLQASNE
jgi:hypothetical protein